MINLDEIIARHNKIGISGHIHPDGDAIGSSLGLYNYIKTYFADKEVHIFLSDMPDIFSFMKGYDEIENPKEYTGGMCDLFFSLDCADYERLGHAKSLFKKAKETVCIDHHISNKSFANNNHIIGDASSTSELVAQLIEPSKFTKDIAECLYTGIVTDTGVFQYSSTAKSTMDMAGMMMEKGIDFTEIIEKCVFEKTFVQQQLMARALANARLYDDGRIIVSVVSDEDYKELGATRADTEGIAAQLRNTKGCEVSVFLYANEIKGYKASLRGTKDNINLADIAVSYGGGGHAKAAGFNVGSKGWEEAEKIVEKIIKARN